MKCPYCGYGEDKVIDTREIREGVLIRRRRQCLRCHRRFTTYEKIEEVIPVVVKKDNRREPFDRGKLISGILKACEKRPISLETIEKIADEIERDIKSREEKEIRSREIGEMAMRYLHNIDRVAYVRFASVYRDFKDLNEFMEELHRLMPHNEEKSSP